MSARARAAECCRTHSCVSAARKRACRRTRKRSGFRPPWVVVDDMVEGMFVDRWPRAAARRGVRARALRPAASLGKLFLNSPVYERQADFLALRERLDPRGAFVNPWFDR